VLLFRYECWSIPQEHNQTYHLFLQNICESVGNVPVHIGARDLKQTAFLTLHPKFSTWSKGYPLTLNDVTLRSKNWVEIIPKFSTRPGDDIDAIKDHFYKPRGRAKTISFSAGSGIDLYLEIHYQQYQKVLAHQEDKENDDDNFSVSQYPIPVVLLYYIQKYI
jgi:hypothetical protein